MKSTNPVSVVLALDEVAGGVVVGPVARGYLSLRQGGLTRTSRTKVRYSLTMEICQATQCGHQVKARCVGVCGRALCGRHFQASALDVRYTLDVLNEREMKLLSGVVTDHAWEAKVRSIFEAWVYAAGRPECADCLYQRSPRLRQQLDVEAPDPFPARKRRAAEDLAMESWLRTAVQAFISDPDASGSQVNRTWRYKGGWPLNVGTRWLGGDGLVYERRPTRLEGLIGRRPIVGDLAHLRELFDQNGFRYSQPPVPS